MVELTSQPYVGDPYRGLGVWWPEDSVERGPLAPCDEEHRRAQREESRTASHILLTKSTPQGVQQWTTLPGQMCSSIRAEIAAVIGALTDTEALHIGIDNQGAMSK